MGRVTNQHNSDGALVASPLPDQLRMNLSVRILSHGLLCQFTASTGYHGSGPPTNLVMVTVRAVKVMIQQYVAQGVCFHVPHCDCHTIQYIVPCFVVPQPRKIGHFITNFKRVNGWIHPDYFRFDSWHVTFKFWGRGVWATKIDIFDAHFHIPLSDNFNRFVDVNVDGEVYQFLAMPFGLNCAPHVFMQFLTVLLSEWRGAGMLVFVLLGDIHVLGDFRDACASAKCVVLATLTRAGFI